jgi:hypothetical protein
MQIRKGISHAVNMLLAAFIFPLAAGAQTTDSAVAAQLKKQAPPKPRSSVVGNAAGKVFLTDAIEGCQPGVEGVAIQNVGDNVAIAYIEMTITSGSSMISGHMNRKRIKVDNLSPNETRFIGCKGCKGSQSGKVCTTYTLLGANFGLIYNK